MTPQETLSYFVQERWHILQRRLEGAPKPWSQDPIFQSVYFCNIRREDDKTTKYIRDWLLPVHWSELAPYLVLARMINRPETLGELGTSIPWNPEPILRNLKRLRGEGHQIFSGAYLITTCGEKMDKLDYVMRVASDAYFLTGIKDTCGEQWKNLTGVKGLGSFLAAQIVADMKNTWGHLLQEAEDWWTFAAPGPGSIRGLNYLNGRPPDKGLNMTDFLEDLEGAKFVIEQRCDVPPLCNQDLQNCMCEYSKYMRVQDGGRTKRNYDGLCKS